MRRNDVRQRPQKPMSLAAVFRAGFSSSNVFQAADAHALQATFVALSSNDPFTVANARAALVQLRRESEALNRLLFDENGRPLPGIDPDALQIPLAVNDFLRAAAKLVRAAENIQDMEGKAA